MKNTNKAFTLVELIVVITILAVLATVAFISFSGQTQEAKKSKVVSDLANLSKAIELTDTGVKTILSGDRTGNRVTGQANSGATISAGTTATDTYMVGLVDFTVINQNPAEFVDADGNPYLFAYFSSGSFTKYQVVGQVSNAAGDNVSLLKGSYFQVDSTNDALGLVSATGASNTGLTNDTVIGQTSIY
jgi:prepilin-type N-terminal cleavage/methylation domain-containing protein